MKKVIRAGILSLTFVFSFMIMAVMAEGAAAGCVFSPGIKISARHNYNGDYQYIHLSKHDLTLQKGKSETLKAVLIPSGQSVSVKWYSSNPKIAKVSSSGKVTAVSPGIAVISAGSDKHVGIGDQTGDSDECYVTVLGGANDVKPLGISDQIFYYGKTKLKAPAGNYEKAIANIKKSIGGYAYSEEGGYMTGLIFGSTNAEKAHTKIYKIGFFDGFEGFGFSAIEMSPIKTSRGISVGAKKSEVLQKYGLPTETLDYLEEEDEEDGKTYPVYLYEAKTAGKAQYTRVMFDFRKSKNTVSDICFFFGRE